KQSNKTSPRIRRKEKSSDSCHSPQSIHSYSDGSLKAELQTRLPGTANQHLFEKGQGARVLGLAEPENGLLAHFQITVGPCYLDELGHRVVGGKLAQGEDCLLFHLCFRILFDGVRDRLRLF